MVSASASRLTPRKLVPVSADGGSFVGRPWVGMVGWGLMPRRGSGRRSGRRPGPPPWYRVDDPGRADDAERREGLLAGAIKRSPRRWWAASSR